jgi:hypothetical protein
VPPKYVLLPPENAWCLPPDVLLPLPLLRYKVTKKACKKKAIFGRLTHFGLK